MDSLLIPCASKNLLKSSKKYSLLPWSQAFDMQTCFFFNHFLEFSWSGWRAQLLHSWSLNNILTLTWCECQFMWLNYRLDFVGPETFERITSNGRSLPFRYQICSVITYFYISWFIWIPHLTKPIIMTCHVVQITWSNIISIFSFYVSWLIWLLHFHTSPKPASSVFALIKCYMINMHTSITLHDKDAWVSCCGLPNLLFF